MHSYQIISDSSCDLPAELLQTLQVGIVPYYASFDTVQYHKELLELTAETFYDRKNQILLLMANRILVMQNGWKMLKIELNMITLRNICQISFIWWISFASVSQSFMILLSLKTENC